MPATCPSACPHCAAGLKRWNDSSTWTNGVVPASGAAVDVTLAPNSRVLLSGCMLKSGSLFRSINVPVGSELIIDDSPMNLVVTNIVVAGTLSMGAPACRLSSSISITFQAASGIATNAIGIRGLAGSKVDIHGAYFDPTWTRLAATARDGATSVTLQQAVNWRVGQLIAVMTSIWKDECRNQNEVRPIKAISADRRTISFNTPLQFLHYGGPEYQTEVVLLSRSILFQGSPAAAMQGQRAGGHVRMETKNARIRGAMAYRMGQQYEIGSYPFHFHMAGNGTLAGTYMTDNSVYNSYWRAYTVHGTHSMLVANNTAFHVHGSAFYIEDGIEERNLFSSNFAGYVHPLGRVDPCSENGSVFDAPIIKQSATLLQPADWAASGFYMSNPNNDMIGNAASGGVSGFLIVRLERPIGLNRASPLEPYKRPAGRIEGNSAHSSGYHWGEAATVYAGGMLKFQDAPNDNQLMYSITRSTFDPRDPNNPDKELSFLIKNTKVWLGGASISTYGDRFVIDGLQSYDGLMGAKIRGDPNTLMNADIKLNTGNSGYLTDQIPDDLPLGYRFGLQFYDTFYRHMLRNITLRNIPYNRTREWYVQAGVIGLTFSDRFKPGHLVSMKGVRWVNATPDARVYNPLVKSGSWRSYNFFDADGSFSERRRPTLLASYHPTNNTAAGPTCVPSSTVTCPPFNWWLTDETCSTAPPYGNRWNMIACDWYPWRTVARIAPTIPGYTLDTDQAGWEYEGTSYYDAGAVAQFGPKGAARRQTVLTRVEYITGLTGKTGWYVHWALGAPKVMEINIDTIPRGTSVILATRYPPGTTFNVTRINSWIIPSDFLRPANNLAAVLNSPTAELYFFDGKVLYVKLIDTYEQPYPGRPAVSIPGGVSVPGTRWGDYRYRIEARFRSCATSPAPVQNGKNFAAQFCAMNGTVDDFLPPAITAAYDQWPLPSCQEVAPPFSVCSALGVPAANCTCTALAAAGRCGDTNRTGPFVAGASAELRALVLKTQGFCSVTCKRCTEGQPTCVDMPMPSGLASEFGNRTCPQMVNPGYCYEVGPKGYCGATCGVCNNRGLPCTDMVSRTDDWNCTDLKSWGSCNSDWVLRAKYCRATCGACAGPPPPPSPPPRPPMPPLPNLYPSSFDTTAEPNDGYRMYYEESDPPASTDPTVVYAFGDPSAAYGGTKGGLMVNVIKRPGIYDWHVQLLGPEFEVETGKLYTWCLWIRLASDSPAATTTNWFVLQNMTTWEWLGAKEFTITRTWAEYCLSNVGKPADKAMYKHIAGFRIIMGDVEAKWHIDNVRRLMTNAPSPPPAGSASARLAAAPVEQPAQDLTETPTVTDTTSTAVTTDAVPAVAVPESASSSDASTSADAATSTTDTNGNNDNGNGNGGGGGSVPTAAVVAAAVVGGAVAAAVAAVVAVVLVRRRSRSRSLVAPEPSGAAALASGLISTGAKGSAQGSGGGGGREVALAERNAVVPLPVEPAGRA
ncbi:hypothetical protein HYH03_007689 [Edaphochlamys debaryana]|uniref:G8 domain-containing protein n=1 Tax=Edaphochlamys debaryana TaxID=47281 RepID=A0A835Y178_9CHLO|nr:hypothetical protein HYH03_007689 [Edaphochlamys debaryana]|eukprot:KAG2494043.1 hypothetical protein HYH03_007689 [Edaphochlamys debaryana]